MARSGIAVESKVHRSVSELRQIAQAARSIGENKTEAHFGINAQIIVTETVKKEKQILVSTNMAFELLVPVGEGAMK